MNATERNRLLATLETRFDGHPHRHTAVTWAEVADRLAAHPAALDVLARMEATGGEPDVIGRDATTGAITFCDCSAETPAGRRSACYDRAALDERKENKPKHSAVEWAAEIGIELLDEAQYVALQQLGTFDLKTSSWIRTPPAVRTLGGALFGDTRYGRVFIYHNGAQSYYASRAFRGLLRV